MEFETHYAEVAHWIQQEQPEKNNNPVPRDAFPFTQIDSDFIIKFSGTEGQRNFTTPMSKPLFAEIMTEEFLPALRALEFMGIDPIPEVHVFADWSTTDNTDIKAIRYPRGLCLMDMDGRDAAFDIALANSIHPELPMTVGHVSPLPFFRYFCHIAAKTVCSTSAHRRYKDRLPGAKFHLIVHTDDNHVELHVDGLVMAAMNDAVECFSRGR